MATQDVADVAAQMEALRVRDAETDGGPSVSDETEDEAPPKPQGPPVIASPWLIPLFDLRFVDACSHCMAVHATKRCTVCSVRYCSAACQRRAWADHKLVCRRGDNLHGRLVYILAQAAEARVGQLNLLREADIALAIGRAALTGCAPGDAAQRLIDVATQLQQHGMHPDARAPVNQWWKPPLFAARALPMGAVTVVSLLGALAYMAAPAHDTCAQLMLLGTVLADVRSVLLRLPALPSGKGRAIVVGVSAAGRRPVLAGVPSIETVDGKRVAVDVEDEDALDPARLWAKLVCTETVALAMILVPSVAKDDSDTVGVLLLAHASPRSERVVLALGRSEGPGTLRHALSVPALARKATAPFLTTLCRLREAKLAPAERLAILDEEHLGCGGTIWAAPRDEALAAPWHVVTIAFNMSLGVLGSQEQQ